MKCEMVDEEFLPRGSGVERSDWEETGKPHLTRIIYSMMEEMGTAYTGKGFGEPGITMEMGFLWEDVLSVVFGERMCARLGEVECDGIVGSPDGLGEDPDGVVPGVVLEEYKCTWKSTKSNPEENWYWMTQVKSYCHMVGVTGAIMRIVYLMGNYRGSGPQYRVWRVEWDGEELVNNWNMILSHGRRKGWLK